MGKEELNQNRDCIPTSEISISPEKYNVLSAMYDVRPNGRDLPQFLVQQALLGRRMGYFGPPGVGKTTVMTQVISCARENAERLGLNYEPTIAQYDLVLSSTTDKAEGDQFNLELENAFYKVTNFENVGVGRTEVKNRGKKAHSNMLAKMASGEDTDTILVALPQVLTNQIHSGLLRGEVAALQPDELFDFLEKHNVVVEGIPRDRIYAAGIIEKYQEMGQEEAIKAIGQEENLLIAEWALNEQIGRTRNAGRNVPSILDLRAVGLVVPHTLNAEVIAQIYKDFGIPDGMSGHALSNAVAHFSDQAIRMEYVFQDEYGIGPERGIVAASPWQAGKITLDLSPYFLKEN